MDSSRKKELKLEYSQREIIGGVCCIRCSGNQRFWIQATENLEGSKNRFNFATITKSSPDPTMRNEWMKYGNDSFSFTVLEELKKKESQTDKEFADDINVLYEMWLEKSQQGDFQEMLLKRFI